MIATVNIKYVRGNPLKLKCPKAARAADAMSANESIMLATTINT